MDLYTTATNDGLFNLMGRVFALARVMDSVRTTNVRPRVDALAELFDVAPEYQRVITQHESWELSSGIIQSVATDVAWSLVRRYIEEKGLRYRSFTDALRVVHDDMIAGGYYISSSTKTANVQADSGNQSDVAVGITTANAYGEECWLYPETITLTGDTTQLMVSGQSVVSTSHRLWPRGSGVRFSMRVTLPTQSLIENGTFESTIATDQPTAWTIHEGVPGTTLMITEPEQQQITMSGGPTGGYFVLTWTDPLNRLWQTAPISHSPTAEEIQRALRQIPGLDAVVVSGTNPWLVTFENTPGDINQLGVINMLTGGSSPSVTVSTTRAGDALSYRGRSLRLVGTGSATVTLYQPLTLRPGRVYFLCARARRTSTATGEVRMELRRSISDNTLSDSSGTLNRVTVNISTLPSTTHTAIMGTFRLPIDYGEQPCVFVLTTSTPINSDQSVAFDEITLTEGVRLYNGGPYIATIAGWKQTREDRWTITTTNSLTALWETVLERWLGWRARLDRKPPTTGTTQIPDSLLT